MHQRFQFLTAVEKYKLFKSTMGIGYWNSLIILCICTTPKTKRKQDINYNQHTFRASTSKHTVLQSAELVNIWLYTLYVQQLFQWATHFDNTIIIVRENGSRVYGYIACTRAQVMTAGKDTVHYIIIYALYGEATRGSKKKKKLYGKRARKVSAESIVTRHTAPESGVVVVAQGPQGVKKKSWPKTSEKRYYYLNVAAGSGNRCLCTRIMLYGSEYDTRTGLHVHKIN